MYLFDQGSNSLYCLDHSLQLVVYTVILRMLHNVECAEDVRISTEPAYKQLNCKTKVTPLSQQFSETITVWTAAGRIMLFGGEGGGSSDDSVKGALVRRKGSSIVGYCISPNLRVWKRFMCCCCCEVAFINAIKWRRGTLEYCDVTSDVSTPQLTCETLDVNFSTVCISVPVLFDFPEAT